MDFLDVSVKKFTSNNRTVDYEVSPDFIFGDAKDLVVKGSKFYAYWNGSFWDTKQKNLFYDIDSLLWRKARELEDGRPGLRIDVKEIRKASAGKFRLFADFCKACEASDISFNQKVLFADHKMQRRDYATTQLTYSPQEGEATAFKELIGTLYLPKELDKILWFMGALFTNKMYKIEKFMYLYGSKGSGKGTVLKIFRMLFEDYCGTIDLKLLTSADQFATGQIQEVPLLIDEDTDISHIYNDTPLLKLTSHETISVNKKFKEPYDVKFIGLLITASNQRYKVRNVDSGITRRAIVVNPSGQKVSHTRYNQLMSQIKYELPYIAHMAISRFEELGFDYYDDYFDVDMAEQTDHIFDFIRSNAIHMQNGITLKQISELYREYLEDMGWKTDGYKATIKREALRYFDTMLKDSHVDGTRVNNYFKGFRWNIAFPEGVVGTTKADDTVVPDNWLEFDHHNEVFNKLAAEYPAQPALRNGNPSEKWDNVVTKLSDIQTNKLHWVKVPLNHVILDFDLKDENGNKNLELNKEAASKFPPTYAEVSKSGQGIHLHYIYDGNVNELDNLVEKNIEIKVYRGKSSLRRIDKASNNLQLSHISSGLPLKEKKDREMYDQIKEITYTEKTLRNFVKRQLGMIEGKEPSHPNTKPTIDFIAHEIQKAADMGLEYDITDLRHAVFMRAIRSTNNKDYCLAVFQQIPWSTMRDDEGKTEAKLTNFTKIYPKEELVFFDIEVYPNLFVVVWKKYHEDEFTRWINPTPDQIEYLMTFPLVGFNNRRYDNHILYARLLGSNNMELFTQSHRIINEKNAKSGMYAAAYELSYTDIYEYSQKKQSLKRWEVDLGIKHVEMEIPWDKPVPDELIDTVVEYCVNDVDATEKLFDAIYADYVAREILATIAKGSMNATNNQLTAKFIFGDDPRPQDKFNYVKLASIFPGYEYKFGKSTYRGFETGEGGFVYAEPGVYENIALEDVESMHPNSLVNMNYFGPYTQRYADLLKVRVLLKHNKINEVKQMFDGVLAPFLDNPEYLKPLVTALKIVINSVYGMTSAKFDNKFKHPDNIDNIVAKRGALFMVDLKFAVEEQGYKVCHIKTDSVKVPNADEKIIKFIEDFGARPEYNYKFVHEHTYKRMALINNAVYIAQLEDDSWSPVGAEYANTYLLKRVWTKEELVDRDFFITKQSKGHIYLGDEFVGKVGSIYASKSGAECMWTEDDENFKSVTGTKGYLFKQTDQFDIEDVDFAYYDKVAINGLKKIMKVGDITKIVDDMPKDYIDALELQEAYSPTAISINHGTLKIKTPESV
uniref:DNA polymerase n=1 Tax=Siphoviridae sp. ctWKa2 TaxID=2825537 RepID=A0A8S5PF66_9CAUD|nr:MAG TPA: DNA polymerase [Siphoviridae sp. ctWKa2]